MADVIRSLSSKREYGADIWKRSIFWEAPRLPREVKVGDFVFLAWEARIRAVGLVKRIWLKDDDVPRHIARHYEELINFIEAGPFEKISVTYAWRGYVGWRYVENVSTYADPRIEKELKKIGLRRRHS